MDIFNGFLSVIMHVLIAVFLLIYLPVSWIWRLIIFVFFKPFYKEDVGGKVILITGASSGIGEELAYQYATKGASLVLVARREQALKEVAIAALGKGSPDVLVIKADISIQSECKRVIEEAIAHFTKLNHLVLNAGLVSSSLFDEITNISAFNRIMDINFWGAVYTTYYAIPHLKNSRGNIIVTTSIAGRVPPARMSFYNASKAALIRFYETLRAELGSDIRITILTPGFIASELTKGKFLQKGGEIAVNEEIRDVQIGFFPVGCTDKFAEIVVESACRGDEYVTWPSWYQPLHALMFFAPEIINWYSRLLYVTKPGADSSKALSRKILEATGAKKFLYPTSIRSSTIKMDSTE
ncbi:LOW QUALITY PROTEIN: 11-beta-hydroxysteroid dehydrogenase 1B-like [Dendrobium catenatum]|uniref:LOW QUALITY PROTEIN: 11-beta-hydroxysteroid dehydrogenase 1B-like n=1 Tax=Dendrobium catenatum TaxID=906689 RepID=UPI0009F67509|nr:LOW QUALITY PROTEIN: 11-beta-hydroxysteroid dehydrogenase 1B-like [Dendrobium catenatum]